jgi:hypothetical protein
MKPKEKAEGESRRRSRRPDKKKKKKKRKKKTRDAQFLPATGKSGQTEKQTKRPNTRRRIQRKRRRNPATTGTLIRHTIKSDLTSSGLCTQVQRFTLCGVLGLRKESLLEACLQCARYMRSCEHRHSARFSLGKAIRGCCRLRRYYLFLVLF